MIPQLQHNLWRELERRQPELKPQRLEPEWVGGAPVDLRAWQSFIANRWDPCHAHDDVRVDQAVTIFRGQVAPLVDVRAHLVRAQGRAERHHCQRRRPGVARLVLRDGIKPKRERDEHRGEGLPRFELRWERGMHLHPARRKRERARHQVGRVEACEGDSLPRLAFGEVDDDISQLPRVRRQF